MLHALFECLSVSVIVHVPHDRGICRDLFDRGKLSAVSWVSSFAQEHASEQKEAATSHQPGVGGATVVPITAFGSSLKQLRVASAFGCKDIPWEAVAGVEVRLRLSTARRGA